MAFVTGASGFCGQHLASHLLNSGYHVVGFDREEISRSDLTAYQGDIADTGRLQALLGTLQPHAVFHLAALTNPRLQLAELLHVNVLGSLSLFNAVRQVCPNATVLLTSTGAVYGRVPRDALPIAEDQPFHPVNPYAVSKAAQEMLAYQQFAAHRLRVIRTRAFNLTGPGESAAFVTSAFARQIAEVELGRREPLLRVGNLESVRDFTDVRDAVQAYRLLAESGEPGAVYNLCSGQGTSIHQVLECLLGLSRQRDIDVEVDPARMQQADVPIHVGDPALLQKTTGWSPTIPLLQTLADVLDSWRKRIQEES